MDNCKTIDVEGALQSALEAAGIAACAPPVPANLAAPMCVVWRLGGRSQSYVQDVHGVSIDCYGSTWAEAAQLADELTAFVRALPGQRLGGVPCYGAAVTTLPYSNTDPSHPTLPRYTLAAEVTTRVSHS